MEQIKKHFELDKYAIHSGITILDIREGWAKCSMKVENYHLNAKKTVHGGALFTLADFTCAVASNSRGEAHVAINLSISYIKAVPEGITVTAETEELSYGKRVAHYRVTVKDEEGDLVATASSTVYRKKSFTG